MRIILTCALLIYWRPVEASSLKIDNSLIEPPRLECLADSISIHIQTKQPFFGRIFVKGQSHLPECSTRGNESTDGSPNHKALHLLFENCFLRRQRVFSPRRGVTVSTIIVVSFHPFFLTGSDGAYRLQCIYLDSKQSLSAVLNVKDTTLAAANSLPTCKYEVTRIVLAIYTLFRSWKADSTDVRSPWLLSGRRYIICGLGRIERIK